MPLHFSPLQRLSLKRSSPRSLDSQPNTEQALLRELVGLNCHYRPPAYSFCSRPHSPIRHDCERQTTLQFMFPAPKRLVGRQIRPDGAAIRRPRTVRLHPPRDLIWQPCFQLAEPLVAFEQVLARRITSPHRDPLHARAVFRNPREVVRPGVVDGPKRDPFLPVPHVAL